MDWIQVLDLPLQLNELNELAVIDLLSSENTAAFNRLDKFLPNLTPAFEIGFVSPRAGILRPLEKYLMLLRI
ncbi:hypothetical protein CKO51_25690 [Rhodopirellula sp. SM50]|nr:hypothetical protein [Rhodopirellula sp. SM50]PAY16683.1 hypothetical protein CKO51_25690 [Rhodopirellula sp. SM50]